MIKLKPAANMATVIENFDKPFLNAHPGIRAIAGKPTKFKAASTNPIVLAGRFCTPNVTGRIAGAMLIRPVTAMKTIRSKIFVRFITVLAS
jgi:hypothetical protein